MIRSIICNLMLCGALLAQSISLVSKANKSAGTPANGANATIHAVPVHYQPDRFAGRAGEYYRLIWGIDSISVKTAEAGEMIRFTYRVTNPDRAKLLVDKRLESSMIDEKAHVKLVVPIVDKVGKLRQTSTPQAGKTYWVLFSNKGGFVKRGDRVNVVIGTFHANGLVVD